MENVRVIQEETVFRNRTSALIKLNITMMEPGTLYILRYTNSGNKVDSLFALGTASGHGPNCYSLISDQSMPTIADIVFEYPDVTEVLYGEVYLLVENATRNDDYEENGLTITVTSGVEPSFSLVQINEDSTMAVTPLSYAMFFSCTADQKYYYVDPVKKSLIDVSYNLFQAGEVMNRIENLEENALTVRVEGNMLVIL